jgi:hypothetical protein
MSVTIEDQIKNLEKHVILMNFKNKKKDELAKQIKQKKKSIFLKRFYKCFNNFLHSLSSFLYFIYNLGVFMLYFIAYCVYPDIVLSGFFWFNIIFSLSSMCLFAYYFVKNLNVGDKK